MARLTEVQRGRTIAMIMQSQRPIQVSRHYGVHVSSINMRRLPQFVRLASACVRLASVSRLASAVLSRVCVRPSRVRLASRVSRLASACVRLASVSRLRASACVCLRASVSRLASACVCLRASRVRLASAVLSRFCLASACVRLASVSRLASVRLCVCLSVSRLASRVCRPVSLLSRVCGRPVSRPSASVRRSSCLVSRLSLLVNACGVWLILCRSSFKEFKRSSYYLSPCCIL